MRRRDRRNAFGDEEAETVSDSRIEVGRRVRSWAEYKGLGKRERSEAAAAAVVVGGE